jgi:outer membrane protein TolC
MSEQKEGVSMKIRIISGSIVCVIMVFITVILQARGEEPEKQYPVVTSANASTELRAVLGRMVKIRERQFEIVNNKFKRNQGGYPEVINTKIELGKAKIRLAQNNSEFVKVIDELRSILTLREKTLRRTQTSYTTGKATNEELCASELDLLEAKAALCTAIMNEH